MDEHKIFCRIIARYSAYRQLIFHPGGQRITGELLDILILHFSMRKPRNQGTFGEH